MAVQSHGGGASLLFKAPWKCRLYSSVRYEEEDYVEFVPDPRRVDDVWTWSVSLSRPVCCDAVEARIGYTSVESGSNRAYADFERDVVSMGLNWSM